MEERKEIDYGLLFRMPFDQTLIVVKYKGEDGLHAFVGYQIESDETLVKGQMNQPPNDPEHPTPASPGSEED